MAPGIEMHDGKVWDDSYLVDSWNDAVKEYQRYHSIHTSGKRLEDVLSQAELKELREEYGDVMEEPEETPEAASEANPVPDQDDTEMTHVETNGVGHLDQNEAQHQEPNLSEQQQSQAPANAENPAGTLASSMPQAILGSVQDENMKNMMMSWYYAGYYTGLHVGQQQTPKEDAPKRQ